VNMHSYAIKRRVANLNKSFACRKKELG
jgi:hypothetical protein